MFNLISNKIISVQSEGISLDVFSYSKKVERGDELKELKCQYKRASKSTSSSKAPLVKSANADIEKTWKEILAKTSKSFQYLEQHRDVLQYKYQLSDKEWQTLSLLITMKDPNQEPLDLDHIAQEERQSLVAVLSKSYKFPFFKGYRASRKCERLIKEANKSGLFTKLKNISETYRQHLNFDAASKLVSSHSFMTKATETVLDREQEKFKTILESLSNIHFEHMTACSSEEFNINQQSDFAELMRSLKSDISNAKDDVEKDRLLRKGYQIRGIQRHFYKNKDMFLLGFVGRGSGNLNSKLSDERIGSAEGFLYIDKKMAPCIIRLWTIRAVKKY